MGDDKYFNHAFKYCLSEQVQALCNNFILFYFLGSLTIARSFGVAAIWVGATK
jgi:hypothetical protein